MIKINLKELRKVIYEECFMNSYLDKREACIIAVMKKFEKFLIKDEAI